MASKSRRQSIRVSLIFFDRHYAPLITLARYANLAGSSPQRAQGSQSREIADSVRATVLNFRDVCTALGRFDGAIVMV